MRRIAILSLAALGLLMIVVTFTPIVKWYARALGGSWEDSKGDVLIVLGGGTIDELTLGPGSYWRCVYGDRVWREGGFSRVVVSGQGVAPLMRDFLVCHGVPGSVIQVENVSLSTRENALEVKKLLAGGPGRAVLLTSDYHMFRALHTFRKAGLDVKPRAFPDVIKQSSHFISRWSAFLTVTEETAKIVYYWAHGWI